MKACRSWSSSSGTIRTRRRAASAQATKAAILNYGVTHFPVNTAMIFSIPQIMGFWEEEGLKVQVEGASGAGPALQQLVAGRVSMTFTGIPTALELINKGAPIRVVASAYSGNVFYPVVLADSPIKSIQDFKGKSVGLTAVASTNAMWMRAILRLNGVDPKEVTFVGSGEGAAGLQALREKRVDALQLYEAQYDAYETMGVKLRRFNDDPALKRLSFVQGLVTRDELIKNDPKVVEGLLRGMAKATVYAHAHPEQTVKMHWKVFPQSKPQGIDEARALHEGVQILEQQLRHYSYTKEGRFGFAPPEAVDTVRDQLFELEVLTKKLPAEQYFDRSFLERVNNFDAKKIEAMPAKL